MLVAFTIYGDRRKRRVIRNFILSFKNLESGGVIVKVHLAHLIVRKSPDAMWLEIAKTKERALFFMIFLIKGDMSKCSKSTHFGMSDPECIGLKGAVFVIKKDICIPTTA